MIKIVVTNAVGKGMLNLDGVFYKSGATFSVSLLTPDLTAAKKANFITTTGMADTDHADTADLAAVATSALAVDGFSIASYTQGITSAEIAASTIVVEEITVLGVEVGDLILNVTKPTEQVGLTLGTARVSAADTVQLQFINMGALPITPTAAETYTFAVLKPTT